MLALKGTVNDLVAAGEIIRNCHCKITVTLELTLTFEAVSVVCGRQTPDTAWNPMTMHSVSAS